LDKPSKKNVISWGERLKILLNTEVLDCWKRRESQEKVSLSKGQNLDLKKGQCTTRGVKGGRLIQGENPDRGRNLPAMRSSRMEKEKRKKDLKT